MIFARAWSCGPCPNGPPIQNTKALAPCQCQQPLNTFSLTEEKEKETQETEKQWETCTLAHIPFTESMQKDGEMKLEVVVVVVEESNEVPIAALQKAHLHTVSLASAIRSANCSDVTSFPCSSSSTNCKTVFR